MERLAGIADPMIVRPSKGVHIVVPRAGPGSSRTTR